MAQPSPDANFQGTEKQCQHFSVNLGFSNTLKYFFGDSGSCNNENYCFQGLRRWPLSCTVIIINVTVVVVDHVKDA